MLLAAGLAFTAPASAQAETNQRLTHLVIEVWPEYDRAGAALVLLRGELAPDAAQPAKVALRLPKASRGPSAVAFFKASGGDPLNLAHEVEEAPDAIVVRFAAPERNFLVELYEPFPVVLPARGYTYTWPGDLAADRVSVIVQEPAGASGIEVRPALDRSTVGKDGLRYLSAELGPHPAGKPLPIALSYIKADARTSADILKLTLGGAGSAPPAAVAPATPGSGGETPPAWVLALLAGALVAIGAVSIFALWKRRAASRRVLPQGACTQCGAPRRVEDRFCGKCGARLT